MDEFQTQHDSHRAIASIDDMLNFVESYGEFSTAQKNAGKHVALMGELSRVVDARGLMQVSFVTSSATI